MSWMEENRENFEKVRKAAWIRTGALGDLIVGLASLAEMPRFFPRARVIVVGPKLFCEILDPKMYPWIEAIAVTERKSTSSRLAKPSQSSAAKWVVEERAMPLSEILRDCDAVLNTQIDSYRYAFQGFKARVPLRLGSAPPSMAWVYTHTSPFFGKDPVIHERDAALLLLEYATPGLMRFFRTTERNRVNLSDWIERSELVKAWKTQGLPAGKEANLDRAEEIVGLKKFSYALINPTSSRREKAWPAEKFHQLLKDSKFELEARGITAIVLGAPNETEWLNEVARDEFKVVQPKSIADLQDVLSGSRGLLTNTSSVQFVATMTGTPTVTLMGRALPEIWGPLGPYDFAIRGAAPKDFAGDIFQEEQEGYRSIEISVVKPRLLELVDRPRVR